MELHELQKIISGYKIITKKLYILYKDEIDFYYPFKIDYTEKFYLIKNNISEIPKCNCGKKLKYKNKTIGYLKTCGNNDCIQEQKNNTIFEKYGVENISQSDEIKEKKNKTNLEKYGVENPFQLDEIKEKIKKTNFKKYGTEFPTQSNEIKQKTKKTNLEKYGVEFVLQDINVKEKIKKTNLEKYGVENPFQSDVIKEKTKKTNLEKYGVNHSVQSDEIKEKTKKTNLEKYGVENPVYNDNIRNKIKKTNLEKYGVYYPFQSKNIQEKNKQTCLLKYGTITPIQSEIIRNKIILKNRNIIEIELNKENKIIQNYEKKIIEIKCLKCNNVYKISRSYFDVTRRNNMNSCRVCNPILVGRSNQENELYEFCKKEFPNFEIIPNYNKLKYEIDVFFPELNFGIEYNGLYWHSEIYHDKNYHQEKLEYFEKQDINILQVWEDDWNYKQEIIKNIIRSKINPVKIYGRKCIIKEINPNDSKIFHSQYHLDGYSVSKIHIGLFYNNELISLCSFGKSRFNKKYEYELSRYTTKENYSIIGGFSKMLKYFENTYNPKSIISYKKLDLGYKNFYEQVGFKKEKRLKPNYYWVVDKIRENRINYQRHKLKDIPSEQSEIDYMYEKGYYRCFDCGSDVFIKNKINC